MRRTPVRGWRHRFTLRLKALLRRETLDRDLHDELAFHLAMREAKNRDRGICAEEARYAARRQFGNYTQTKERTREMWTFVSLEEIFRDIRIGLRLLRKSPGFSIVTILTLALGIGANSAIFSVVNAILLRPLPYPDPGRLVRIWESSLKEDDSRNVVNPLNFLDWRDRSESFEAMAAMSGGDINLDIDGRPIALPALTVSPEFFSVLGVPPLLGRTFVPDDGLSNQNDKLILSYQLWRGQFGADPSIVGKRILVDGLPHTIVGVMPESFSFPKLKSQFWLPMVLQRDDKGAAGGRWLTVVARLKLGVSLSQAREDIASVARYTAQVRPDANYKWTASVFPMLEDATLDVRRPLWVLLAAVGFLLLIACANVANLLLMRGAGRFRELAVRSALGAARFRIIQQLLVESLLLSLAGMCVGLIFAYFGLHALLALIPQDAPLPRSEPIVIDARVFLVTLLATLFTAVLFGLLPALRLSRVDPQQALSQGSLRSGVGGGTQLLLRRCFVVAEVALALLLSVGAGLMLRSFARLIAVDPGFQPQHLVSMHIWTAPSRYSDKLKRSQYFQQILTEIRRTPGVESASSIHFLPLEGSMSGSCFASIDQPPPETAGSPGARFLIIGSDYFKTMGTPMVAGREFEDRDRLDAPPLAVVNQAFVRKFSPHQNVIGRQFNVCWTVKNPVEVVGVVADSRQLELQDTFEPTIFLCNEQAPMYFASIVVRAQGDPRQILRSSEEAIHRVDPDQAVSQLRTMDSVVSDSVSSPRFQMTLLLVFAALALLLAMTGVFGVVSNSVTQRTQEIGIRMALGARSGDVARMVLREALLLSTIAVAVGLAGAFALTRLLQSLLFEVSPTDPTTLLAASLAVLVVANVATILPAHRAMTVDPLVALRYE
jgi:predicted permease